jgi:predicted nucleic acid-binding protein
MTYLLDVNVLLAMSYVKHVHHDRAEQWVNTVQGDDDSVNLATCSITELGFVRVASGSAGFAVNVTSRRSKTSSF